MGWIIDNWSQLGVVAGKAALMFAVAVFGLRIGERRTVAEWTIIDFVTTVAIGAIVGRTALAAPQSFLTGAVALLTLVALHRVVSLLRFHPPLRILFEHRARVLVHDGTLRRGQLRLCGLVDDDVFAKLRGVFDLAELQYLLYESTGVLTIVRTDVGGSTPLIRVALNKAAGFRRDQST